MLTKRLGDLLSARNWHIAVAESATGGLIGHLITQVSGSSRYFLGGVIAYSNAVKRDVLGVQEPNLQQWGAVSPQVAAEMARGTCRVVGAEVGVSVTGIAGPTGATEFKPVGLYYIGVALPTETWVWRHLEHGDRQANNEAIAWAALQHVVACLG